MTFYIGQKKAGEIFLGGKKIGRIYLGQTLVHMTAVVSKPTFLEYIEFDGNSRIDTGIIPSNNMEFEAGVMFSVVQSTNLSIIASRDGEKRYQPIGAIQNKWSASIGGMYDTNGSPVSANTKYDLRSVVSNGDSISLYSGNTLVSSATSSGGIPTRSLYLFARNYNSLIDSYVTGRLYYCKIWDNGVLIQDLRPALDPSGKVCMYDMVSKKYFYNEGTGELKAGGRFVESIVFDGASYIDTGITQQTCTVECGIKFANADTRQLMGFHSSNSGYWGCRNTSGRYEASGSLLNATVSALDYNDVVIDYNCDDVTAPSVRVTVKDATASVVGTSVLTARIYIIGALLTSGNVASYRMTGQVYYNKFYIGGELVQDLRPYVDSDGVACFKDVVTDTLFYNKGTGTLTYTEHEELEYLELDGTKYIDSGFMPSNNTRVIGSAMFDQWYGGTVANYVFGVFGDNRNFGFNVGSARTFFNVVWGASAGYNNRELGIAPALDTKYDFDVSKDGSYINGILYISSSFLTATFKAQKTMYIGWSNGTSAKTMSGRMYPMKVYDNGTLVRDMIPVKRSDGVSCMYDRVENKYYELKGA